MAIAATYVVQGTALTTSVGQLYTVPSTGYNRDLVVTNAGTVNCFVGLSGSGTVATSVASFQIPPGGSVVLTQCQVPAGAVLSALTGAGNGLLSIGYGSVVSVV
jgi:hypothetical protein